MQESRLSTQLRQICAVSDSSIGQSLKQLTSIFETLDPDYRKREPAAVCVLFRGHDFARAEVLLTLRSATVTTHASQVAFPGGSFDPEDGHDPRRAAARECREEVGIPEDRVETHAVLEAYPTFGGSFFVHPVVASLRDGPDLPLIPQPEEVVLAEWVPVADLIRNRHEESREVYGQTILAPYFMWSDRRMWGLSAWIFDSILHRYASL